MQTPVSEPDAESTLLWIGDRSCREFARPFEFATQVAAQIAWRSSLSDAVRRPAGHVGSIIVTRLTRSPLRPESLDQLRLRYPHTRRLGLLGSSLAGDCPVVRMQDAAVVENASGSLDSQPFFNDGVHYWHRWNQVLPPLWESTGIRQHPCQVNAPEKIRSVAVIASSVAAAEPLVDLADAAGATVVWSKQPDPRSIRNVDAVWWDESSAPSATVGRWRERLARSGRGSVVHAWITSAAGYDHHRQARAAGVDVVLTKPFRIAALLETLRTEQIKLAEAPFPGETPAGDAAKPAIRSVPASSESRRAA